MGRSGKTWRNNTARKGWAAWLTPAPDNAPPASNRRTRDCTAGVCETSANNLLVAATDESCAKLRKDCRLGGGRREGALTAFDQSLKGTWHSQSAALCNRKNILSQG